MRKPVVVLSVCVAGCAFVMAAQEVETPHLNARDLFYGADQNSTKPTPKPAPAASGGNRVPARSVESVASRPTAAPAKAATAVAVATHSAPPASPARGESDRATDGVRVVPVVDRKTTAQPLGLRYSVLQLTGGDMLPVPSDRVFHAGDRIQLSVETNLPGYLYVVSRGTSGAWKPIFPMPGIDGAANRVEAWHPYTLPPNSRMVFNDQTGVEKLFIVFSRLPETDIENLMHSLPDHAPDNGHPVNAPANQELPKPLYASLTIDDAMVGRMRNVYSRDLVVEHVDETTPPDASGAGNKDVAVYVVNPKGAPDSRVVADIELVHQ